VLDGLFQAALKDSLLRQNTLPTAELERLALSTTQPVDAVAALSKTTRIRLIAEIKRASPSRGDLAAITSATAQGLGYESAGADAISVLTERTGFKGSLLDLEQVSAATNIPTLRKDFISTEYQLLEARAAGAAMALLILAWLPEKRFLELKAFAHELGLAVLVETHSEPEIDVAARSGAKLIGINTRNLVDFKTDIGLFEQLAGKLPADAVAIAESSVKTVADVRRYRDAGADAVLVGEALVTGDYQELIPEFISVA
jgi:indole-3-glycerol phosphate synthase